MSSGKEMDAVTQTVHPNAPSWQEKPMDKTVEPGVLEVGVEGSDSDDAPDYQPPVVVPWQYKWIALLCVVAFPIGQTWTQSSLGPLKNTLRDELGINNSQFGVISSSDAIINSIWPIIGGLLLDWFGPNIIVLICTSVIFIGSLLAAGAINLGAWRMITGGHVFMGFGIAVLDSAQQKFFYHWFGASGLAFAFGLESAVAKVISLSAGMTAIPIRNSTGWYGWSFWIPAIFCGFSVFVALAYLAWDRFVVPKQFRIKTGKEEAGKPGSPKKLVTFAVLFRLPWAFWMLPMTQLLQSGAAGGFSTSSADIIRMKGFTEEVAGYLSTAQEILPIVLSPVVGLAIDKYGHRFHYVAAAPILWVIACSILGYTDAHPLSALVFSSLAGVINSMPLQICIPLLVADQAKIGTAFGVWRAFNNSGSTIMEIAFGVLQDSTPEMGYFRVLNLAIGLKSLAFLIAVSYIVVDYRLLGKGMTMTRSQRQCREAEITHKDADPLTRRVVSPRVTYAGLALLGCMVVTAWVLFVRYLM